LGIAGQEFNKFNKYSMRKIIVSVNVTLDGYMAGENGELDWHFPLWNEEMSEYAYEQLCMADTVLLGRQTYEAMAAYYPYLEKSLVAIRSDIAFARHMNDYQKIIFSRTLKTVEWKNARLAQKSLAEEIRQLKSQPGLDIIIYGSASIVAKLIQLDLIDEYVLWVHPVLLGNGKSLFKNINQQHSLNLLHTRVFDSGVIILYYQSIYNAKHAKMAHGSFRHTDKTDLLKPF
jgi:dihydrofolate reductase